MTNSFRELYRSTRPFRYRIKGLYSKSAAFRWKTLKEEAEWRKDGYHYRDIAKDGWVIGATGTVYIAVSKSANTTMKSLIAEEIPSEDFLNRLKGRIPEKLGSDDTLIHFYTPSGMTRLRDHRLTPGDLAAGARRCFTVVRHPVDRFVSAWRDKVAAPRPTPLEEKIRTFLGREEPTSLSIDDLITYVAEVPPEDMDKHVRPQWSCCGAGRIPLEMVGKVEHLERDIRTMADAGLISAESAGRLAVRNASRRASDPELNRAQTAAITRLYERDFETFGY